MQLSRMLGFSAYFPRTGRYKASLPLATGCKYCFVKTGPRPCITEVHLVCNLWKLILTSKISQALLVMMIALELGTQSPKWIQILASVNSPNVGHLKLFHLETMQWYLLFSERNAELSGKLFFDWNLCVILFQLYQAGLRCDLGSCFFCGVCMLHMCGVQMVVISWESDGPSGGKVKVWVWSRNLGRPQSCSSASTP